MQMLLFWFFISFSFQTYSPGSDCRICFEDIVPANYTHVFECEHADIHKRCVDLWIVTKGIEATCPVCRALPLIPIVSVVAVSVCKTNPALIPRLFREARWLVSMDSLPELLDLIEYCEFSLPLHYSLFRMASSLNRWTLLEAYIPIIPDLKIEFMLNVFNHAVDNDRREIIEAVLYNTIETQFNTKEILLVDCIIHKKWVCTTAFVNYFNDIRSTIDIGRAVIQACAQNMPAVYFDGLIFLHLRNASIKNLDLAESILISIDKRDWLKFSILWTILQDRNFVFNYNDALFIVSRAFKYAQRSVFTFILATAHFNSDVMRELIATFRNQTMEGLSGSEEHRVRLSILERY